MYKRVADAPLLVLFIITFSNGVRSHTWIIHHYTDEMTSINKRLDLTVSSVLLLSQFLSVHLIFMAPVTNGRVIFNEVPTGELILLYVALPARVLTSYFRLPSAGEDSDLRRISETGPRDGHSEWRTSCQDSRAIGRPIYAGQDAWRVKTELRCTYGLDRREGVSTCLWSPGWL